MDTSKYERRLTKSRDAYQREVEKLAADVRRDLVVPICRKYDLEFISGMGSYSFSQDRSGEPDLWIPDVEEARRLGFDDLVPVLTILNMDVDPNNDLGHYVADVKQPASRRRQG